MRQDRALQKLATRPLRLLGLAAAAWMVGLVLVPSCAAKKPVKTISTPDGRPVRKVYIRTASPETANSVTAELSQDTCLTPVTDENQADAVLDLGMALPGVGAAMPTPGVFVPSAGAQTMGNAKTNPQRSASANCTNGKDGGCNGSYTTQGGDLGAELPAGFAKTSPGLDVSLISTGKASQELWEPESHGKRPWIEQLRRVAGCPVCPGEHFHPHKGHSYRDWIQARCPSVVAASGLQ